jgi:uncharacterized membrane protein
LFAGGHQLPVCARDTGIYAGFALGILVLAVIGRWRRPTELPGWPVLLLLGLFIGAMVVDGVTSYAGLRTTTNSIRLATGLMTGWALSALTMPMLNSQLWVRSDPERLLGNPRDVGLWLAGLTGSFLLLRWVMPMTGVIYPLGVSVSIIVTLTCVNLVFVGLMPAFERKADRLSRAVPQLLIALVLSAAEMGAAAWLKMMAERLT